MNKPGSLLPSVLLKALADPVRLRIVEMLARPDAACCSIADRVCACDLERLLGLTQPTISHHMKRLSNAGLVEARKAGKYVFYRLNRTRFHTLAAWLEELAGEPAEGAYPVFAEDEA
ncbi:MAG: metalloregulator ArsR/SmtB family transcription factor [Rhodospirillales bacterium]|nr:metalloregulator ArsR/SmtB family transcription factor [Rhodospirillales bacterium]